MKQRLLHRNLHMLSAVVRKVLEEGPLNELPEKPISIDQMRLLRLAVLSQDSRIRDVAHGLGIKAATASLTVDRLEAKGFLERRSDLKDKRAVYLEATSYGQEVVQRTADIIDGKLDRLIQELGSRKAERLTELMAEAVTILMRGEHFFGDICLQCGAGCSSTCVIHAMFHRCPHAEGGHQ